jgi:hypothetical protein
MPITGQTGADFTKPTPIAATTSDNASNITARGCRDVRRCDRFGGLIHEYQHVARGAQRSWHPQGRSCFAVLVDHVPAAAHAARMARVSCWVAWSGHGLRNLAAMMTRRSLMTSVLHDRVRHHRPRPMHEQLHQLIEQRVHPDRDGHEQRQPGQPPPQQPPGDHREHEQVHPPRPRSCSPSP